MSEEKKSLVFEVFLEFKTFFCALRKFAGGITLFFEWAGLSKSPKEIGLLFGAFFEDSISVNIRLSYPALLNSCPNDLMRIQCHLNVIRPNRRKYGNDFSPLQS